MKNIQLILAYDGSSFLGWQKTVTGPSIEESLESVLRTILQEPIVLQAAGRTDAGVHAEGQSVNFFTKKMNLCLPKLLHGLNSLLPPSIRVLTAEEKPPSFHPTLDAKGKEYVYYICNVPYQNPKHRLYSWHIPLPLSREMMEKAANDLLGEHDFSSFCNERSSSDRNPVCTLSSITLDSPEKGRLSFSLQGDRFLYKMVRNLVGTLIYVGEGKIPVSEIQAILSRKNRIHAGVTAPAKGLFLSRVFY